MTPGFQVGSDQVLVLAWSISLFEWRRASEAGVRQVTIVVGAACSDPAAGMMQRQEKVLDRLYGVRDLSGF